MKRLSATKKLMVGGLGLVALAGFIALGIHILRQNAKRSVSPKGYVSVLEGYSFSSNAIRYDLPRTLWNHTAFQSLPKWLLSRVPKHKPEGSIICQPLIPGEPILSCAFSVTSSKDAQTLGALRIVVSDENGNEFDPVGQSGALVGYNPVYWANEVIAFPRRDRKLFIKVKQNAETVAEFKIPNPAMGEYPQWKPEPLPQVRQSGELQVSLVGFKTQFRNAYSADNFPSTVCAFVIHENGNLSTNWTVGSAEFMDATGNHWRPYLDPRLYRLEGSTQLFGFFGALWKGEDAWKLKLSFKNESAVGEKLRHFEFLCKSNHE